MPGSRSVVSSAKLIAVCTLVSRVTGLARDVLLASAFGLGWIQDAFVYAFAVPNLFRRLFGEGAMAPVFVPTFTQTLESEGREPAWRLLARTLALMTVTLSAVVLIVLAIIAVAWLLPPADPVKAQARRLLLGLTAVMLPFMLSVCILALFSSILNCVGSFVPAALAPILLNLGIIVGIVWAGPAVANAVAGAGAPAAGVVRSGDPTVAVASNAAERGLASTADAGVGRYALVAGSPAAERGQIARVYTVAVFVLLSGFVQLFFLLPFLRRSGVRLGWRLDTHDPTVQRMIRLLGPVALGQGVLAFGVFLDAQVCTMLSHVAGTPETFSLFGLRIAYPLREGALSAVTYAQRLYQFPLGVLVISLATAALPAFSRLAHREEWPEWTAEVRQSLRLAVFEGILAGTMMLLLAEPMVRLLFERGRFTPADTPRAAYVVVWYGVGLWAFCAQHIVLRAFYSTGDVRTPLRISVVLLPLNVALNLALVWFSSIREAAFAISTSITSALSVIVGLVILQRRTRMRIFDAGTLGALGRMLLAAAASGAVLLIVQPAWTTLAAGTSGGKLAERCVETFGLLAIGACAFLAAAWLLRLPELHLLLPRRFRRP